MLKKKELLPFHFTKFPIYCYSYFLMLMNAYVLIFMLLVWYGLCGHLKIQFCESLVFLWPSILLVSWSKPVLKAVCVLHFPLCCRETGTVWFVLLMRAHYVLILVPQIAKSVLGTLNPLFHSILSSCCFEVSLVLSFTSAIWNKLSAKAI